MNVAPQATFEAVIETGETGQAGTLGVEANDNQGVTVVAFTTAVVELVSGVYAAPNLTAPDTQGQYTLIWRLGAGGDVVGIDDLNVTYSAPGEAVPAAGAYATVEELQQLLRLNAPTSIQVEAMQRALDAAAAEIDWDLGFSSSAPAASPPHPLIVEVNLERAVEHWRQAQSPFGVIGIGSESEPVVVARNSWYRHHLKLSPLRLHQGIA